MKPQDWRNPNRASAQYEHDLFNMLLSFFKDIPATVQGITARLLSHSEFLDKYARQAAQRMVTGRYVAGAKTWQAAARQSMQGNTIYTLLNQEMQGPVGVRFRELIAQNSKLIRSLPHDVAAHVSKEIATRAQEGDRAEVNIPSLLKHVSRTRAALIARTETSKASSALTRARAEELQLGWYVWRTSEDARVRLSHRRLDGVLVSWDRPPSPEQLAGENSVGNYNAGDIWNCRCYSEPLLRTDQVRWPAKVYFGGSIRRMTLANFKHITQQPLAA